MEVGQINDVNLVVLIALVEYIVFRNRKRSSGCGTDFAGYVENI